MLPGFKHVNHALIKMISILNIQDFIKKFDFSENNA